MRMNTMNEFNLESYLSNGVENIIKGMLKFSNFHPREGKFLAQYALAGKKARNLRKEAEARGEHVPPFLIASITSVCNLHCAGCYARSLETCVDGEPVQQMSADEWEKVFREAGDLGIGFILLAGGEPMVRKDIIEKAASFPDILFPIFTNGTLLTDDYLDLFDRHRNLVPILSMEGGQDRTDERRGNGVYQRLQTAMEEMKRRRIPFGISVTVTTANLDEVTSDEYIRQMADSACKAIIYVEFVPTNEALKFLALDDEKREILARRLVEVRQKDDTMLLISFPGDEKSSGGCLAAGRGFFHINSQGGAEPCPFSPYSDTNVRNTSLKEVMNSKLFRALQEQDVLQDTHEGGCVLFEKRQLVEEIVAKQQ